MTPVTTSGARGIDVDAVIEGRKRLSVAEALALYQEASLRDLGRWATAVCDRIHGPETRTYVIDRNINYTNVCSASCTFCAFKRDLGDAESYVLDRAQLHEKIGALRGIGGTQILLQGGMHPELSLDHYERMLAGIKEAFPEIHVHGFSPPELVEFVAVLDLPGHPSTPPGQSHRLERGAWLAKLDAVLERLQAAGLDTLPGGGGEIFAEQVRRRIGMGKASAQQWLDVMRAAHKRGMNTSATMMFGHIEGVADRIDHMRRIRDAQDEALADGDPGRFVSFISWPFQPENTPLGRLKRWEPRDGARFAGDELAERVLAGELDPADKRACRRAVPEAGRSLRLAGAEAYLRTQAVSRLFLDNIHSIGASWVTMGPHIGQLGLFYGANDMGSVMMEENVVSAAGTTYCLDEAYLCHLIRDAGHTPAQRDNAYRFLRVHDGDDAPDLRVTDWRAHRAGGGESQEPVGVGLPGDKAG